MLVTFPLDHVVLSLAEESMLWTEESAELKQLAAQFFESLRCMFQLRRNGSRMQQCTDPRATQFRRPKVLEMVEWKLNRHARNSFEGVVAAFVSNAELKNRRLAQAPLQLSAKNEDCQDRNGGHTHGQFREQLAMLCIER